jgi:hypothetical protein
MKPFNPLVRLEAGDARRFNLTRKIQLTDLRFEYTSMPSKELRRLNGFVLVEPAGGARL